MAEQMINVFVTTIPGFKLPPTLSITVSVESSVSDVVMEIMSRLPPINCRLTITTNSNKDISICSQQPVTSLLQGHDGCFIPLRLSAPLCGGKGGFGSQLRAAGGRMSSKSKKKQGESNGSSRNLDGRRLRTVTEAKALAEYLALKPKMDEMAKETRRQRWEEVVVLAEKREDEIKNGSKGKVDGQWMEHKEESGERTREAVLGAMRDGHYKTTSLARQISEANEGPQAEDSGHGSSSKTAATASSVRLPVQPSSQSFFGFEEDEEFMSEESDNDENNDFVRQTKSNGLSFE